MKKSINAWSIPDEVSFEEMFRQISAAGYDGIELNLDSPGRSAHSLDMDSGPSLFAQIRSLSKEYRLPVCSISSSLYGPDTLGSCTPAGREKGRDYVRKQLECARELGADGILVVPGGIGPEVSIQRAYENCQESLGGLTGEIAAGKVKVGLENVWNNFFASPVDMRNFIDELGCPNIGAYFDVGNVMIFSYPEHWIEILGERIVKIHVKDFLRTGANAGTFVNLLEGSIDWKKVMDALRRAGYDGYLTAEVSAIPEHPQFLYDTTCMALRRICSL